MNAAKQNNNGEPLVLRLLKGGRYTFTKREKRISDFWRFCHSVFWNTDSFTIDQEEEFLKLIADHFNGSKNSDKTFKELVERALLARRYVDRSRSRYMPSPAEWLNIGYTKGLAGTKSWHAEILNHRKSVPQHKSELREFAEAILRYLSSPTYSELALYRCTLLQSREHSLVRLLTDVIFRYEFLRD
jgi:hypothetical protein